MSSQKILFLGDKENPLFLWLKSSGENVVAYSEKGLSPQLLRDLQIDFIVSYGYRHLIQQDVLDMFPAKVINLHISYLPWNKGADPNLWSFIEGSPKGVTIHYVDAGLDTGDIIVQKEVPLDPETETLKTSYQRLSEEILRLFQENWLQIKNGSCPRTKQAPGGSSHRAKEKQQERIAALLSLGWDTPVKNLIPKPDKS